MNHDEGKELDRLACILEKVRQNVEQGLKESALGLEHLSGEVKVVETVMKVHMAQQVSINLNLEKLITSHDGDIRRLDRRQAYAAGGIALLIVLVQLAPHIIRLVNGG